MTRIVRATALVVLWCAACHDPLRHDKPRHDPPPRPLLLAADCEAQWGPDCAAPADTRLDGEQLVVSYEEQAASDGCETLQATLSLTGRSVTRQERRRGTHEKHQCRRQAAIQPLPLGDGSAERPLLTLHQ